MENSLVTQEETTNTPESTQEETSSVNVYPMIRHLFLTLCILLTISIILFLIYQNGKSIYDKGL